MAGYSNHKEDVLKRLRRIEGQVRGLQRTVEEDTYCIDVLTQVSATTRALQSFALPWPKAAKTEVPRSLIVVGRSFTLPSEARRTQGCPPMLTSG
ncbi:metal-sensitive transcriptional regulator [Streptomyces glaucescens]|uniref:metal-sensitive transcriptional regulator n=1 Tax=Streptomyces glaucescens TaxID=1907 RepID=UPI003450AD4B